MQKINLKDLTFIIPVMIDNKERLQNLWMILYYINNNFDTNIIVAEQNGNLSQCICDLYDTTRFIRSDLDEPLFYKTKLLNIMLKNVKTDYVASYDCDVLFTVEQYVQSIETLRNNKSQIVLPFDKPTANIGRDFFNNIIENNDPDNLPKDAYYITSKYLIAPGGSVFIKTETYKRGGGENEHFISYGQEDVEKLYRFQKLGYSMTRADGFIYHLNHSRGINSTNRHSHHSQNEFELMRIKKLTSEQIYREIHEWKWYNELNK